MSILVGLRHTTTYRYDRRINLGPQVVRLRPAPHCRTPIVSYSLNIRPDNHFINWIQDPFSNYMARLVFPEKTAEFTVDVDLVADLTAYNPFDFFVESYAEKFPFEYPDALKKQLAPFLETKVWDKRFAAYLADVPRKELPIIDFLVAINQRIWRDVSYTIRLEPGVQTPEETLQLGSGSCRDSAWLLVQLLRYLGLAARFASGYLVQLTADQKSLDGPSGPEADFTDLHAWTEVYVPGAGWVGLDPTSGLFAAEGHIPLSCTPDPVDSAPITGALDECEVEFAYSNEVTRLKEDPRVTRPFTDQDWLEIDALGHYVDSLLEKNDVRLTMGGEPTFVSIDDMESEQWNTEADGPHKRKLALDLTEKLMDDFAEGGLLHFGQGKWYPGEPLPRWQYSLYWRKDGVPLWHGPHPTRVADATLDTARGFMNVLCDVMGLPREAVHPCYEDPFHSLWQNAQLPIDDELSLDHESLAKRTLAKIFEQGLNTPTGFCLPIAFNPSNGLWQSCRWQFRQGALYLVPGNSPIGYRLPLSSLSYHAKVEALEPYPADPFAPLPQEMRAPTHADYLLLAPMAIHTALCAEIRDGYLTLFLPPLADLESFNGLTQAIATAAEKLNLAPRLEGYQPPFDPRLSKLVVAPDPGVIEVNIQPAKDWDHLKHITETLYQRARESRLGTEKFMLDGRHSGTGGGNHVTMGGVTPADSPLLRRPDLLRSLLTFWQHHPSLSYLFSGLFIGPTSQAPRVDEGRIERLYELEIAFSQLPRGEAGQPWLVDRALRHLLVDLTGNTHRSEFCIDKLYSPDSATGRLGILEFRSFEMPPHARMSLVQMLLLRACVAAFWEKPYHHKLVDWGHQLHDRFMLPHFINKDFDDVLVYLNGPCLKNGEGLPFKSHWFDAFKEFRCPRAGHIELEGMELELRHALEPWHVLGEEATGSGTSRYVDSSVERMQVKVRFGTPGDRYVLTCNGKRVPLIPTGEEGTFVAGIRYRAWQPWSALHPMIGVHSPLVFDFFDTWNGRALGGCTYHVAHPGGRSYETFPVNALEAESRRVNRFEDIGHTHGRLVPPPPHETEPRFMTTTPNLQGIGRFYKHVPGTKAAPPMAKPNPSYPFTLDLRFDS
ncbi:MAG TPA: transglutaminase family protein [Spongiibacteraceae bacterium]|nr:transglutaminase family protein [Spongiibacteraceae bacterium]